MIRFTTMAAITALLAAGSLGACAGNRDTDSGVSPSASIATPAPPSAAAAPAAAAPSATAGGYTDAQIASFVAARRSINQLTPGATPEAQQANQQRIGAILQENNLAPDVYNAITTAARSDQALNNRISVAAVGDDFTDVQLRAFIAASTEIQPLNASLASGTPEQRAQTAEQIRGILQRNSLDLETYNGIAAQVRTNTELQTRLNTLAQTRSPSGR